MISVVIPVYNEQAEIVPTLDVVLKIMEKYGKDFEIIVVNDGSTDGTTEKLAGYPVQNNIKLLFNEINRGYGYSLKKGIRHATGEIIAITDADGTYPNECLPELLDKCGEYHMVVGARTGANVNIPLIRRPAKKMLNILANYLSGVTIPDLNSGLRVFKKSEIMKFFPLLPDGFSFTTTSTLGFLCNGREVFYMPIDYMKRSGSSKIRPVADTLSFISLIVRTVMYFNPLKIFIPVSAMVFSIGVFILFFSYFYLERVMDITVIVCILSSIQIAAIGLLADLFVKRGAMDKLE